MREHSIEFDKEMHLYARVILQIGLDLKQGQSICAEASVEQHRFVTILAHEAYQAGASKFEVLWQSDGLDHARLSAGASTLYSHTLQLAESYASEGYSYIRLENPCAKEAEELSPEDLSIKSKERNRIRSLFRQKAFASGQTVACVPSRQWADQVYPELPPDKRLSALWNAVLVCTRCADPDPLSSWKQYLADTARRKNKLDEKMYQCYRFLSSETDLTIYPAAGEKWRGSCIPLKDRRPVPNIPTEEIFLAPSKYRVDGYVKSTKPLCWNGSLIDGISLRIKDGRIIETSAKKGDALLKQIIETDSGSHYLGEMALVDNRSLVAQQNRIFYTTLFDENASCHLAIGNAICPISDFSERELRGYNTSAIHIDFMIGSDDMCVYGLLPNGNWEEILINGQFKE